MSVLRQWRQAWDGYFVRWVDRRAPRPPRYLLRRDNLYIFPTRAGFVYSGLIATLWLLGTNYQNNLIFGLSLLLLSLFVLTILHTHANLAGLEIQVHDAEPGHVGQELAFHLSLDNKTRRHKDGIHLSWPDQIATVCAIDALENKTVTVCIFGARRGYLYPGRLRVETVYPLGLLRCWTWLPIEARTVVFPQPRNYRELLAHTVEDDREAVTVTGAGDFAGMHEYRPGDPLKQIAWKSYAQGKALMSKEYSGNTSTRIWLAWESVAGLEIEQCLSTLCFWALHYQKLGFDYGLNIPGTRIEPGNGPEHRRRVLTALAVYGQGDAVDAT